MRIALGLDSLCWHMRLVSGGIAVEGLLENAASLEAAVVALNLHHVRERSVPQLRELLGRARSLGLRLLAQGDFIGSPRRGDEVSAGVTRIDAWVERAAALARSEACARTSLTYRRSASMSSGCPASSAR